VQARLGVPLICVLATALLAQVGNSSRPRFEDFPVTEMFDGKPAPPRLVLQGDRLFRTMIRDGALKGPNFAGHYTIAEWGCGSACVSMALVDAKDGRIYRSPFGLLGAGDTLQFEEKDSPKEDEFHFLAFRLNSRLLVVKGCPEDKDCATYYYEWTGSVFKLTLKVPPWSKYLSVTPVSLSGTVVDENGRPIPDVWVAHAGVGYEQLKTDQLGRFRLRTQVPAVIFRKEGFVGEYYRLQQTAHVNVKLRRTSRALPACAATSQCNSLARWDSVFCFPNIPRIRVSSQTPGDYYKIRWFGIGESKSQTGIRHSAGTMSSLGVPSDPDVWSSVEYSETAYPYDFVQIVDARGRKADGKVWRFLGRSDETASYHDFSSSEAAVLDKVLDGVCIRSIQQRR
jgi:hypothetical protein